MYKSIQKKGGAGDEGEVSFAKPKGNLFPGFPEEGMLYADITRCEITQIYPDMGRTVYPFGRI
jgi:hypothetical protein